MTAILGAVDEPEDTSGEHGKQGQTPVCGPQAPTAGLSGEHGKQGQTPV
jgi:hypothetical protein